MCVSECPQSYPIIMNRECTACSSDCLTCSISSNNCTSCSIGMYLFRYACLDKCPLGTINNILTNTCSLPSVTHIVLYFPFFLTLVCVSIMVLVSRLFSQSTAILPSIVSLGSLLVLGSWLWFLKLHLENTEEIAHKQVVRTVIICALGVWLILNIAFYVATLLKSKKDPYFTLWINFNPCNYYVYMLMLHLSILSCRLYRLLYSRLFNLTTLSLMFKDHKAIFTLTTIFSVCVFLLSDLLAIASAVQVVYYKNLKDQLFYSSIELILTTGLVGLLTLLDIYKPEDFFNDT